MNTVTVKISPKNFAKGVSYAKKFGGKYDPTTKTWAISGDRPELGNLGAYYLIRVEKPAEQESEDSMMGIDDASYWRNLK